MKRRSIVSSLLQTTMSTQPALQSSTYPPAMQNSLQAALNNREAMDSVALDDLAPHPSQVQDEEAQTEAMHLRGGCFEIPCPGFTCDCCVIPCTIA
ncbi:uncharacterized protein RHTO_03091 [Rhodotorula toruloides NP11]|nr:uncharacterized protein RHTO_03091 [Rhodotorula toruloides NP11]EMS25363.1 hypothetical protein RHTO_03091 [Rhodotorula toruloides NP11]